MKDAPADPETAIFPRHGRVPNSRLPLLLYRDEFSGRGARGAVWLEETFAANGWTNSWRNGVYPFHHYHANTHEVLGVYQGSALLRLGGEEGGSFEVRAGDVIVIPAGVAHRNLGSKDGFAVVGAYPDGIEPDLKEEGAGETGKEPERIDAVAVPAADPVRGRDGGLVLLWRVP